MTGDIWTLTCTAWMPRPNSSLPACWRPGRALERGPLLWTLCAVVCFTVLPYRVPIDPEKCPDGCVWVRGWRAVCRHWGNIEAIVAVPAVELDSNELWVGAGRWTRTARGRLGDRGFQCLRVWVQGKDYVVVVRASSKDEQCVVPMWRLIVGVSFCCDL